MRTAGVGDGELLRGVTLRSVEEAPYAFGGTGTLEEELGRTGEEWATFAAEFGGEVEAWRGKCVAYLVFDGQRVCGKAICFLATQLPTRARMTGVWVDPGYRRRGVGRRMVEAAMGWARERGADHLRLWVDATNPEGRVFYERLGFRETGERGKEGEWGMEVLLGG